METGAYVERMRLDGGHPALDFVNTLGGLREAPSQPEDEHLRGYLDVAVFASRVELLDRRSLERLLRSARRRPDDAESVFQSTLELRSLIDGVFRPIAHRRPTPPDLLNDLREAERTALAHASLEHGAEAYRWGWPVDALEAPLWLVTNAAVELLTTGPLGHLQPCGRCRWLFLDLSKNQSRRWCSMAECGTTTKKLRYVKRRRARRTGRAGPRAPDDEQPQPGRLPESARELGHDPVAQHVRHGQDLAMNLVVVSDAGAVIAPEVGDRLGQGEVEVVAHHRAHLPAGPVPGVRLAQEAGDLIGVAVPRGAVPLDRGLVARLSRAHELGGAQDVLAEQRGQPCTCRATVERLDGIADVLLVSKQPRGRGRRVGQVGCGADDEEPRPGDVVLPQTAHLVMKGESLLADAALRGARGAVLRMTLGWISACQSQRQHSAGGRKEGG